MQDTKDGEKATRKDDDALSERQSEATSKETLSDVEESEEVTSGDSIQGEPGPSPDGQLDETGEVKDAGPM